MMRYYLRALFSCKYSMFRKTPLVYKIKCIDIVNALVFIYLH